MVADTRRGLPLLLGHLEISSVRRLLLFLGCLAAALMGTGAASWASNAPPPAGLRGLFILLVAALLWVTEALPAFAVGILVIGLRLALLGVPGSAYASGPRDWEQFVEVLGHPLIWLFFGGFILAAAAAKTALDRRMAMSLLPLMGTQRKWVLAGSMGLTFAFSMFMSNTATAAMMMALLSPFVASLPKQDRYARGLILGVAAAANLGGMGSLIGTPPNAIAVGAIAKAGKSVSFMQWLVVGLPPAAFGALLAWWFLVWRYNGRGRVASEDGGSPFGALAHGREERVPRWQRWLTVGTFTATLLLWVSGQWHGIPTTIVSFLPIIVFTATGVLGTADMQRLPWDILFLLAGGLALGDTVVSTGVADWIVGYLPAQALGRVGIALIMAYACTLLSNLMSNTAAANVLVPIGVTLAVGFEADVAIPIAIGASSAMYLPISTPPNALAYASGHLRSRDFWGLGLAVGVLTPIVAVAWMRLLAALG